MLVLLAPLLASLVTAPQPLHPSLETDRTAWIFSTITQSEWCPAGNVMLDLRSGRYALTPGAARSVCNDPNLQRSVTHGTLRGERLAALRRAYRRVLSEGLESETCRNGGRPEEIYISTGGVPILVITTGAFTFSAPEELGCWTEAADAFHHLLDRQFGAD
jgi:hypothetical protein